jgi:hypothetical protein
VKALHAIGLLQRRLQWTFCGKFPFAHIRSGLQADKYKETEQKCVSLPEKEAVISTMLQELYGVYNPTTGSLFASFANRSDMEKLVVIGDLVMLFMACDKVWFLYTNKLRHELTYAARPELDQTESRGDYNRSIALSPRLWKHGPISSTRVW